MGIPCSRRGLGRALAVGATPARPLLRRMVSSGGTDIIYGFDAAKGDRLLVSGYGGGEVQNALAGASVTSGSTVRTFSDNTIIVLMEVTNLGPSAFA